MPMFHLSVRSRERLAHPGHDRDGHGRQHRDPCAIGARRRALVFTINSFRKQTFTDVANAYCTVQKLDTGEVLAGYDLTGTQPRTALLMAELRRGEQPAAWRMRAIGEFHDFRTVKKLVPAAPRQVRLGGQPAT